MESVPGTSDGAAKSTIWRTFQDKDPTKDLLQIVGSERIQSMLLDRNVLKKRVWLKVAEEMMALGYDLGPDGGKACHQKWRNLKRAYIMYITKPGQRDPPYIKDLQKALETTRKLITPSIRESIISIASASDSGDCFDGDQSSDVPLESPNNLNSLNSLNDPDNPNNPNKSQSYASNIHIADVLAFIVKNNEERQRREEALESMCEERFKKLEQILKRQGEQLKNLNDTLVQLSNQCAKKRKYCETGFGND